MGLLPPSPLQIDSSRARTEEWYERSSGLLNCGKAEEGVDAVVLRAIPPRIARMPEWQTLTGNEGAISEIDAESVARLVCSARVGAVADGQGEYDTGFALVHGAVRQRLAAERDEIRAIAARAEEYYRQGIALETLHQVRATNARVRNALPYAPDSSAIRTARSEFRFLTHTRFRNAVENLMIASGETQRGPRLGSAHETLINCIIDELSRLRAVFVRRLDDVGAESMRPSDADMHTYHRIKRLRTQLEAIEATLSAVNNKREFWNDRITEVGRFSAEARDIRRSIMPVLRTQVLEMLSRKRTLSAQLIELGARPGNIVGLERQGDSYFEAAQGSNNPEWSATARTLRNGYLHDLMSVPYPDSSTTALNDEDRWELFNNLRENLFEGVGVFSWQSLRAALFRGYANANARIDIGIDGRFSVGTYIGHGQFAVDVNAAAGQSVRAQISETITLPERMGNSTWRYKNWTEVVKNRTRATTAVQDVFAKIAYGIGFRRSSDIEAEMEDGDRVARVLGPDVEASTLTREERRERLAAIITANEMHNSDSRNEIPSGIGSRRTMDPTRVITGLVFNRLVEDSIVPPQIQEHRVQLISEINTRMKPLMRTSENIFLESVLRGQGSVGFVHAVRTPFRRDIPLLRSKLVDVISNRDLLSRLWAFMWLLLDFGAEPHRRGAAVTVDHFFENVRNSEENIVVRVFTTHLSGVEEAVLNAARSDNARESRIPRNSIIGRVGATGNANSSHNHVEITVYQSDRRTAIGNLDPHQALPRKNIEMDCSQIEEAQ